MLPSLSLPNLKSEPTIKFFIFNLFTNILSINSFEEYSDSFLSNAKFIYISIPKSLRKFNLSFFV